MAKCNVRDYKTDYTTLVRSRQIIADCILQSRRRDSMPSPAAYRTAELRLKSDDFGDSPVIGETITMSSEFMMTLDTIVIEGEILSTTADLLFPFE